MRSPRWQRSSAFFFPWLNQRFNLSATAGKKAMLHEFDLRLDTHNDAVLEESCIPNSNDGDMGTWVPPSITTLLG